MSAASSDTQHILELIQDYILYYPATRFSISDVSTRAYAELKTYPESLVLKVAEQMMVDSDPDTRFTGARMLLATDVQNHLLRTLHLLSDDDEHVRGSFAMMLSAYKDVRAVPALIAVLENDPCDNNRVQAAETLGDLGDPRALPALQHAAHYDTGIGWEDHSVAYTAEQAINRIQEKRKINDESRESQE